MTTSFLGLDIGGTKIFTGSFSDNFHLLDQVKIPTQAENGREKVLQNICSTIEQLKTESTSAIGIALAGFINTENGIVEKLPNIPGFEHFPLASFLQKRFNIPVYIGNDSRLFAFAEQKMDAESPDVLLGIIIGTGVGSGIILKGNIFHGSYDFAGEIGHTFVDCRSGEEIEEMFSARAIRKIFSQKREMPPEMETDKFYIQHRSELREVLEPVIDCFAMWIYNLSLTFDPTKIVFGGGIGKNFWVLFEEDIRARAEKLFRRKKYPMNCKIAFSRLQNAGAVGAAILARESVWHTHVERNFKG